MFRISFITVTRFCVFMICVNKYSLLNDSRQSVTYSHFMRKIRQKPNVILLVMKPSQSCLYFHRVAYHENAVNSHSYAHNCHFSGKADGMV